MTTATLINELIEEGQVEYDLFNEKIIRLKLEGRKYYEEAWDIMKVFREREFAIPDDEEDQLIEKCMRLLKKAFNLSPPLKEYFKEAVNGFANEFSRGFYYVGIKNQLKFRKFLFLPDEEFWNHQFWGNLLKL